MITDRTSLAVVVNPAGAQAEADVLAEHLDRSGIAASWLETTPDDPGVGQTGRAVADGANLVVACGGDGTVRACIQAAAGTDAAVGIMPAGTGNLLARNLGIPLDPQAACDVFQTGRRRRIDLGYANDEAFAVMAGIGIDARIMRDTDSDAKKRFGPAAYVATALAHLRDERFTASLLVDGREQWAGRASSILVANHGEVQGGLSIFPDASAHDGRLDSLVATADGLAEWLRAAWAVLRDDPAAGPIQRFSGVSFVARTTAPVPYEIDGEERDATTEVNFSVVPSAVSILVPKEDAK